MTDERAAEWATRLGGVAARPAATTDLAALGPANAIAIVREILEGKNRWGNPYESPSRRGAILALGKLGADADEAIPLLVAALAGNYDTPRGEAAQGLGAIGSAASAAMPALVAALHDEEVDVALEVAKALGRIGGPEAVAALVAAIETRRGRSDRMFRRVAAETLGRLGADARAASAVLTALLRDEEDAVRRAASEALRLVDPDAARAAGLG